MTFQAKLDAEREAEANRRGLPLWKYDMSRATDTGLIQDVVRDNIRGPSAAEIDAAIRQEQARQAEAAMFAIPEAVVDAIACAGYTTKNCPQGMIAAATRLIGEGLSPGAAGATLFKRFR
jgi:hypothetical protein